VLVYQSLDLVKAAWLEHAAERGQPKTDDVIPTRSFACGPRRDPSVTSVWRDARLAVRNFGRSPGFTAIAVLTLALGVGAGTSIFSIVNGVLLSPLPYPEPDRLVRLVRTNSSGGQSSGHSGADFVDIRSEVGSFEHVAGYNGSTTTIIAGDVPRSLYGASVTSDFFNVLGRQPLLGRTISPDIDVPGGDRVVILSYGLWQSLFGGDVEAVGAGVSLDGEPFTVVGVMPEGFAFPARAEFWAASRYRVPEPPSGIGDDPAAVRGTAWFSVLGRLRRDTDPGSAQAELTLLAERLRNEFPDGSARGFRLVPLRESIVGAVRSSLYVLLAAVGFLLLIACANVANLLLVRGLSREKEFLVRTALGANRLRLFRQLITESLVLSLVAGLLGFFVANWGTRLPLALAPAGLPRLDEVTVDVRAFVFAASLCLVTGVLFGLLPAYQCVGRRAMAPTSCSGGRQTASRGWMRVRNTVVVCEIALSLLLTVGAGLVVRTFIALNKVDPGFDPSSTLSAQVWLPTARYQNDTEVSAFYREMLARVGALPGVQSAGAVLSLPVDPGIEVVFGFSVDGRTAEEQDGVNALYQLVSEGYFETLGIDLVRGRLFSEADDGDANGVAVINEALVERYFPGEDPIGKRLTWDDPEGESPTWATIVGIVGNIRHEGLDEGPRPETYRPFAQAPMPYMTLVVRSEMDVSALTTAIQRTIMEIDPQQPVSAVRTLDQVLAESLGSRRLNVYLLGFFAVAALVLAGVGLYGVMSFSVAERSKEIGIRMALGAQSAGVVGRVVRDGIVLALIGLTLGTAAALLLTRAMTSMIHGVHAADPLTFACAVVSSLGYALFASFVPALRAARVDPVRVLN